MAVIVQSLKNQFIIADKCHVAVRFFDRLIGLISKSGLEPGEGMLFPRCNDIHMWFMRIPIDVVFIRDDGHGAWTVTSVHERVRPWRILPLRDGQATETLELPVGSIRKGEILAGDLLCIS